MTMIYELDLDILKMYLHSELLVKVVKVTTQIGHTHTHRPTNIHITTPHLWVVKINHTCRFASTPLQNLVLEITVAQ